MSGVSDRPGVVGSVSNWTTEADERGALEVNRLLIDLLDRSDRSTNKHAYNDTAIELSRSIDQEIYSL